MSETVNRLLRRWNRASAVRSESSQQSGNVRNAIVEVFERREITGWVEVERDTGPVRVDLCVNDEIVARSWAAPKPGRRVYGELLQFRFGLTDLWKYTKRKDDVTVRVAGKPVPIARKGTFYRPRRDGLESLHSLQKYLADGYVFGQSGRLQLSKALDTEWQGRVVGLYERVNQVLADSFDLRALLCYGTLLGVVRDNGFIGHDMDFDCAYVSRRDSGRGAADELADVSLELMERGFNVVPKRTCLAVKDDLSADVKIDVYHLYYDQSGNLSFPFGIAGAPDVPRKVSTDVRTVELAGHDVLVPHDAERIVEILYGASWRTPNPGFRWQNDRTTSARDGIVTVEQVDEITRANVTPSQTDQRSSTAAILAANLGMPELVVEVGSSLGDQSAEIAQSNRRVIGLERTAMSVRRAERHIATLGLADRVEFHAVDIYDPQQLAATIKEIRGSTGGGDIAFYARAFPEFSDRPLRSLVAGLQDCGQPGDYLVADFRTAPADRWPKNKDPDAASKWTVEAFRSELEAAPAWSVVQVESAGSNDDVKTKTGVVVARRG